MVKSLEQYLTDLPFADLKNRDPEPSLSAQERSFVEKYLGLDMLESMPRIEPAPQDVFLQPARPALKVAEPEIKVASPEIIVAPLREEPVFHEPPVPEIKAHPDPAQTVPTQKPFREPPAAREIIVAEEPPEDENKKTAEILPARETQIEVASQKPEPVTVLRDSLREQESIQVVSFFVSGQLFLLPVSGIQEVLRHMELVRVPQAPDFIAGAINLRGKVTPLVHLSALLTNETNHVYDPAKNFIIICGAESMQIGLIIDKINSMHVVPQKKFIWNAESKLGDAAEFLYAIADLDDRVCGVVSPDVIIKKIASS